MAAQSRRRLRAERQQPAVVDVAPRPARSGAVSLATSSAAQLSLRAQLVLEALDAHADVLTRLRSGAEIHDADAGRGSAAARSARGGAARGRAVGDARRRARRPWPRGTGARVRRSRGAVLFERFIDIHEAQQSDRFAVPWDVLQPMTTPRGLANPDAALAALERAVARGSRSSTVGAGRVGRGQPLPLRRPRRAGRRCRGPARRLSGRDVRRCRRGPAAWRATSRPDSRSPGFGDAWVLMVHFTQAGYGLVGPGVRPDGRPCLPAQPRSDSVVRESRAASGVVQRGRHRRESRAPLSSGAAAGA